MASTSHPISSPCLWRHTSLFNIEPVWSHEPNIEVISSLSRQHLGIPNDAHVEVTFLSQGAFNKLYVVASSFLSKAYIFRATLSVEPYLKTASEAATLKYLRRHTSIPVPDVIAYSAIPDTKLGYEWILMEYLPGVCLRDIWPNFPGEKAKNIEIVSPRGKQTCSPVDWKSKEDITRKISEYFDQLKLIPFKSIGSIYFRSDITYLSFSTADTGDSDFVIGPLVSLRLFYGGLRGRVCRNLGPYSSEREYIAGWVEAQLSELELVRTLDPQDPQYDKDAADESFEVAEGAMALRSVLDVVFSASSDDRGYILHHDDLSLSNILINPNTLEITGIVDWEATGAVPRWEVLYPHFITGPDVKTEPETWVEGDTTKFHEERWEDWEKAQLRSVFSPANHEGDIKREFVERLKNVELFHRMAVKWAHRLVNVPISLRVEEEDAVICLSSVNPNYN